MGGRFFALTFGVSLALAVTGPAVAISAGLVDPRSSNSAMALGKEKSSIAESSFVIALGAAALGGTGVANTALNSKLITPAMCPNAFATPKYETRWSARGRLRKSFRSELDGIHKREVMWWELVHAEVLAARFAQQDWANSATPEVGVAKQEKIIELALHLPGDLPMVEFQPLLLQGLQDLAFLPRTSKSLGTQPLCRLSI